MEEQSRGCCASGEACLARCEAIETGQAGSGSGRQCLLCQRGDGHGRVPSRGTCQAGAAGEAARQWAHEWVAGPRIEC